MIAIYVIGMNTNSASGVKGLLARSLPGSPSSACSPFLCRGLRTTLHGFDEALGAEQPEGTITVLRLFFVGASVLTDLVFALNYMQSRGQCLWHS